MINTLGFDFGDTFVGAGDFEVAARFSTESNLYCPDPACTSIREEGNTLTLKATRLSLAGGQMTTDGQMTLTITRTPPGEVSITGSATHPSEACKTFVLLIRGIGVKRFVADSANIPGHDYVDGAGIRPIAYPSREATMPLVFVETGDGEVHILSKDTQVRRKAFAAFEDPKTKGPVIVLSHDEDARDRGMTITLPEWKIGRGRSRIDVVRERCDDLDNGFDAVPFKNRPHTDWIDDLRLVVNFHGEHWTGYVFNTFDQMGTDLSWVCEHIDGNRVLAFLPAWDGRYYGTYPEHRASERMGGTRALKKFVKHAHGLGVKVVLMLGGPNLATFSFLEGFGMLNAAMHTDRGLPMVQDWVDWNGDLSREAMGYVVNFGHDAFREYLVDTVGRLFDDVGVDGVHLDGSIRWENTPDYSPYEGMVRWANDVAARYPDKLLMAEDGFDAIWGLFGIHAAAEAPLGLENAMLRYTRQTYYLSKAAANGSCGIHEEGWFPKRAGGPPEFTIPTLSLIHGVREAQAVDIEREITEAAKWERAVVDVER